MTLIERLDTHFRDFLELRASLGYSVGRWHIAPNFCEYLQSNYPDENIITKQMFDEWLCQYEFTTTSYQLHCVSTLRTFLRYLVFVGEDVFLPDDDYLSAVNSFEPISAISIEPPFFVKYSVFI
jgi:hypothetical protein